MWEKIKAWFLKTKPTLVEEFKAIESTIEKIAPEVEKIEEAAEKVVAEVKKRGRKKKQ